MANADSVLDARAGELKNVDQAVMDEVVGVAQAIGDLRKALDALGGLLDDRQFEKAAASGYQDLAWANGLSTTRLAHPLKNFLI